MFDRRSASGAAAAVLALALGACSGRVTRAIEDVRTLERPPAPAPAVSSAERFGLADGAHGPGDGHDHGEGGGAPELRWTLPGGWHSLPPTATRRASFRVDGADGSLVVLPGGGGGLVANVDRWCGQMGLAPLGADGVARLERRSLLGLEAVLVDLAGDFRGMGAEALPDARLLGLIAERGSSTFFLKLVGPADVVEREREAFEALAASFELTVPAAPSTGAGGADGLAWDVPPGWTRGTPRPMRLATFVPEGASDVECSLTVLPGRAGGARANVDRWRGQVGLGPLDEAGWAALPRLRLLGVDAPLVEIEGDFAGMDGARVADAALLGAIADLGDRTLFLKMTGPAGAVRAERARFLALCTSLRRAEGP